MPVIANRMQERSDPFRLGVFYLGLLAAVGLASCERGSSTNRNEATSGDKTARGDRSSAGQWFVEITGDVGLNFVHETGATGELHMPEIMASGVALVDYDNDGDLDLYFTNGNHSLPKAKAEPPPMNRLYRQEPGGRFVDVTQASGLGDGGYGMGVVFGDIDNDGYVDAFVANYGPSRLYRNRGDGTFADITEKAGINVDGWSCSVAMLDYDRDGFLDIYVTRYLKFDHFKKCTDRAGRPNYCDPKAYEPVHDVLLHNNGNGAFSDVSERAGILAGPPYAGLGVVCGDFNQDGWQDIYVANDGHPNNLWINQKDGTFRDDAFASGCALNAQGKAEAGMGVVAADLDNDADLDFFITHLSGETNTIYRNLGGETGFEDATAATGVGAPSLPWTGFGTAAFDAELDGDLDLVVVNGRVSRADPPAGVKIKPPWDEYAEPNLFQVSDGAGRFTLACEMAREFCEPLEITRGLAVGDIDSDGDIDLVISNIQGPARMYRNDAPQKGHWLIVRAVDPRLKREAIGAQVTVTCAGRKWVGTVQAGSSYLSHSDTRLHFGLGDCAAVDQIEVRWPDGLAERFDGTPADRVMEINRGTGTK